MMGLRKAASAEPAAWIVKGIRDFAKNVGSVVPEGFEAYARVFHPASTGATDGHDVSWREIAASAGRVFHPQAQWPHIAFTSAIDDINGLQNPPPGAPWVTSPSEGSLDLDVARRLVEILTPHSSTPEKCWFAVWDGWGGLRSDATDAPSFELPWRRYFLFEGPIVAATQTFHRDDQWYQSAALWWPEDRAWCVATEVDFESTYIGGTQDVVEELVADPSLEALEIGSHDGITWHADQINPNPLRLQD